MHAILKFDGITVHATCLISENFISSKYTCYTVLTKIVVKSSFREKVWVVNPLSTGENLLTSHKHIVRVGGFLWHVCIGWGGGGQNELHVGVPW